MLRKFLIVTVVLCLYHVECETARILAIFPTAAFSHQVVFRKLTVELSKRGHELVVFTTEPLNDPELNNYFEVDLHHLYDTVQNLTFACNDMWSLWKSCSVVAEISTDAVLSSPKMQRIIQPNSREHFDLIIVEYSSFHALHGLKSRVNAPVIGITSYALHPHSHYLLGNPPALAYSPGIYESIDPDMNFWGRLYNAYRYIRFLLTDYYHVEPLQEILVNKYFGSNMSRADELAKDVDLVLVNDHAVLGYPRPNLPGIIEIGGIAVDRTLKGLSPELKKFLDGAVNGFVYFSLGSNTLSKNLSPERLDILKSAFTELPYKVLWKYELDVLPGKPENVFISKWLPQYDVLAHPNIKVFVTQGGLQSTEEAISNVVPVVGLPNCFDQGFIVRKLVSVNVGKQLSLHSFSKDELRDAVIEVGRNKTYKESMRKLRDLFNDNPQPPVERAVWWTEYVIRHNGIPHFRTRVRHMAWYQRELLDILVFVITAALVGLFVIYKMIDLVVRKIMCSSSHLEKSKVKTK